MWTYTSEGQKLVAEHVEKWTITLDGKKTGEIRNIEGRYVYFPKGSKEGGESFSTAVGCMRSLV